MLTPMSSDLLAGVPLFALLDNEERAALAAAMESRQYAAGAVIFTEGAPGDEVLIVQSGSVEIFTISDTGERIVLSRADAGDVFGEISLFDGGPRTATAVADEAAELFALDRDALFSVMQKFPHIALDILGVMGKRLRTTDVLLRSHVSRNVNTEEEDRLTFGQRIADRVASFGGSWTFIITFGAALALWVMFNTLVLKDRAFDPYPYILLNLFLSMLAALQAPVIMMSQNRQSSKDRLKADMDYDVNLKSELEIAQLHRKMDQMIEHVSALR
jgi:uncharacterized membrane protein